MKEGEISNTQSRAVTAAPGWLPRLRLEDLLSAQSFSKPGVEIRKGKADWERDMTFCKQTFRNPSKARSQQCTGLRVNTEKNGGKVPQNGLLSCSFKQVSLSRVECPKKQWYFWREVSMITATRVRASSPVFSSQRVFHFISDFSYFFFSCRYQNQSHDETRRHPLPLGPPRVLSSPCISQCCLVHVPLASASSPVFLTLADSWLCHLRGESCFPQGYSGCLGAFAPVLRGHLVRKTSARLIHTCRLPQLGSTISINCYHPPGKSRKKQFSPRSV